MSQMLLDTLRVLQDLSLIWPCFAFAVVVSVIGIYIRWYISPNRKVAVECWFCQTKTKVPRAYCNDWMCSECKQYNGFSNDGDYRKPVPGQMSNGTASRFCRSNQTVENFSSHSNVFCRSCAANQQLKVQQLARFEPLNEDNFDSELAQFRLGLEKSLGLCSECSSRARHVIRGCDRRVLPKFVEWQRSRSRSASCSPKKPAPRALLYPRLPSLDAAVSFVEVAAAVGLVALHFAEPKWRAAEAPVAWGCMVLLLLRISASLFSASSVIVPGVLLFCWAPVHLLVVTDVTVVSPTLQREVFLVKSLAVIIFIVAVITKDRFSSRTSANQLVFEPMEADEIDEASCMEMDTGSPLPSIPEPPTSDVTFRSCRVGSVISNDCSTVPGLIRPSRLSGVLGSTVSGPHPPSEPACDLRSLLSFPPSASVRQHPSPSLCSAPAHSSPSFRSSPAPSICSISTIPAPRPLWQQVLLGLALGLNAALIFYWCVLPLLGKVVSRL